MSEQCFICGEDNPNVLQDHHILPRRHGGGDSDENLVTLCANCHAAVEQIYDDEFYERAGYSAADYSLCVDPDAAEKHIQQFLETCDGVGFEGLVAKRALYDKYCEWADDNDAPRPAPNVFGKVVVNYDDKEIEASQRRIEGTRTNVYTGVHVQ